MKEELERRKEVSQSFSGEREMKKRREEDEEEGGGGGGGKKVGRTNSWTLEDSWGGGVRKEEREKEKEGRGEEDCKDRGKMKDGGRRKEEGGRLSLKMDETLFTFDTFERRGTLNSPTFKALNERNFEQEETSEKDKVFPKKNKKKPSYAFHKKFKSKKNKNKTMKGGSNNCFLLKSIVRKSNCYFGKRVKDRNCIRNNRKPKLSSPSLDNEKKFEILNQSNNIITKKGELFYHSGPSTIFPSQTFNKGASIQKQLKVLRARAWVKVKPQIPFKDLVHFLIEPKHLRKTRNLKELRILGGMRRNIVHEWVFEGEEKRRVVFKFLRNFYENEEFFVISDEDLEEEESKAIK